MINKVNKPASWVFIIFPKIKYGMKKGGQILTPHHLILNISKLI